MMLDPVLLSQVSHLGGETFLQLWGDGSFLVEDRRAPSPPLTLFPRREVGVWGVTSIHQEFYVLGKEFA